MNLSQLLENFLEKENLTHEQKLLFTYGLMSYKQGIKIANILNDDSEAQFEHYISHYQKCCRLAHSLPNLKVGRN